MSLMNHLKSRFSSPRSAHIGLSGTLLFSCIALGCANQEEWSEEAQTISKSSAVYPGDSCSAGCVWSSYAVTSGLQTAEVSCSGGQCACVVDGDAAMSCEADTSKPDLTSAESGTVGSSCSAGCIWSAYAVSQGAQSATASCDGAPCACVEEGDIWSSCEAGGSNGQTSGGPSGQSDGPVTQSGGLPDVPYFYQYDNRLYPGASCQNTSVAMVLSYLGWRGTPDQITGRYGKDWAQSPAGLAALFNTYASNEQLSMRIQPVTSGTFSGLRAELDRGHPVIVHGYFTSYGHVLVVLGYDANGYYVNDPAGKWSGYFKGGYAGGSGRKIYYSKSAFETAVGTSNGYASLPLWYHALR